MNKVTTAFFVMAMIAGAYLHAQDDSQKAFDQIDQMGASPSPAPKQNAQAQEQEPTEILASTKTTFDNATKVAVLYGDVKVHNPQFTLSSDKLTVYFHKEAEPPQKAPGTKKSPSPAPKPSPTPKPSSPTPKPDASVPAAGQSNSIDKVIAEGNVVIVSDRPDPKGGPPVHYVGKGAKVVYTPATGEAILTGMPQLQQGTNTMVALDESTVIYLNRDGQMHSDGPVKMIVTNPPPDKAATPAPERTPEIR